MIILSQEMKISTAPQGICSLNNIEVKSVPVISWWSWDKINFTSTSCKCLRPKFKINKLRVSFCMFGKSWEGTLTLWINVFTHFWPFCISYASSSIEGL